MWWLVFFTAVRVKFWIKQTIWYKDLIDNISLMSFTHKKLERKFSRAVYPTTKYIRLVFNTYRKSPLRIRSMASLKFFDIFFGKHRKPSDLKPIINKNKFQYETMSICLIWRSSSTVEQNTTHSHATTSNYVKSQNNVN